MNQAYSVAIIRGVLAGLIVFGLTTLGSYQTMSSWEDALVSGGIAGLSTLALRAGIEGTVDSARRGR